MQLLNLSYNLLLFVEPVAAIVNKQCYFIGGYTLKCDLPSSTGMLDKCNVCGLARNRYALKQTSKDAIHTVSIKL